MILRHYATMNQNIATHRSFYFFRHAMLLGVYNALYEMIVAVKRVRLHLNFRTRSKDQCPGDKMPFPMTLRRSEFIAMKSIFYHKERKLSPSYTVNEG